MGLRQLLQTQTPVLAESAVLEVLRRDPHYRLEAQIDHARAHADARGAELLGELARQHIELAANYGHPLLLGTPTFRAQGARLAAVGADERTNLAAAEFMLSLREQHKQRQLPIMIAGIVGPRGDCYLGEAEGSVDELRAYHRPQIKDLVAGGVDLLQTATIPTVKEAKALALEMSETGKDYLVSVVLRPNGRLPDGHTLTELVDELDQQLEQPPLGYGVNCSYPGYLDSAATSPRLCLIQANASATDPRELEGSQQVHAAPPEQWAAAMRLAQQRHGLRILGGCCGTTPAHLQALAQKLN